MSRNTTLGHRSIRSAITLPSSSSAIPREISSRSVSVNILRWQITRCSSSTVSPTIYTKINCFDRLGSRMAAARLTRGRPTFQLAMAAALVIRVSQMAQLAGIFTGRVSAVNPLIGEAQL